ncbi:MAG TPA: pitrilysin family protein [Chthonomonadales bacterium]|nr:pitrilysin family protein [Chthonomonadales bacterium]
MIVRSALLVAFLASSSTAAGLAAAPEHGVLSRTTANGLRIVARHDPTAPAVAIRILVRAGVADEGRTPGIARVTAWALFGENESLSRERVAREIDAIGGSVTVDVTPDYTVIGCYTTDEAFEHATWVLALALRYASFDARSLQIARSAALAVAERERANAFEAAYLAVREALHDNSPYRLPFGGDPEAIASIRRDAVAAFHRARYVPANVVVAVDGGVPAERAIAVVERSFADMRGLPGPRPRWLAGADTRRPFDPPRSERQVSGRSTVVALGVRAPAVASADYSAFVVVSAILGQGKASRLFRRTREEMGLGYSVGVHLPALEGGGHMVAHIELAAERGVGDAERAERVLLQTVRSLTASPPTSAEIARAKRLLSGQWLLGRQRASDRALQLGRATLAGAAAKAKDDLPAALQAVTTADIQRVVRRYLSRHVIAVARPTPPTP